MEDRIEIRRRVRQLRQDVSNATRVDWSQRICNRIIHREAFTNARNVAGFLAFDGEANPMPLLIHAVEHDQNVFVPIIIGKGKPLKFAPWTMSTKMKRNRFGIKEPDLPESEWIDATELDFVITPLVAFDKSCNRIGVGGGFYDRTFAFVQDRDVEVSANQCHFELKASVTMVGFAFELQKLDAIEAKAWDVRLDGVATEQAFYLPN